MHIVLRISSWLGSAWSIPLHNKLAQLGLLTKRAKNLTRLVKLATRCGSKIINISISKFQYVIDMISLVNCASNTDEHNLSVGV
jgi:hypothetical protein